MAALLVSQPVQVGPAPVQAVILAALPVRAPAPVESHPQKAGAQVALPALPAVRPVAQARPVQEQAAVLAAQPVRALPLVESHQQMAAVYLPDLLALLAGQAAVFAEQVAVFAEQLALASCCLSAVR